MKLSCYSESLFDIQTDANMHICMHTYIPTSSSDKWERLGIFIKVDIEYKIERGSYSKEFITALNNQQQTNCPLKND